MTLLALNFFHRITANGVFKLILLWSSEGVRLALHVTSVLRFAAMLLGYASSSEHVQALCGTAKRAPGPLVALKQPGQVTQMYGKTEHH